MSSTLSVQTHTPRLRSLGDVPAELLLQIIEDLSMKDILNIRGVNKRLHEALTTYAYDKMSMVVDGNSDEYFLHCLHTFRDWLPLLARVRRLRALVIEGQGPTVDSSPTWSEFRAVFSPLEELEMAYVESGTHESDHDLHSLVRQRVMPIIASHISFESLIALHLSGLNVKYQSGAEWVFGKEKRFPKLKRIIIDNCYVAGWLLRRLAFEKPRLTDFAYVNYKTTEIEALRVQEAIPRLLKHCKNLRHFYYCSVDTDPLDELRFNLRNHRHLLSFGCNRLPHRAQHVDHQFYTKREIARLVKECPRLRNLAIPLTFPVQTGYYGQNDQVASVELGEKILKDLVSLKHLSSLRIVRLPSIHMAPGYGDFEENMNYYYASMGTLARGVAMAAVEHNVPLQRIHCGPGLPEHHQDTTMYPGRDFLVQEQESGQPELSSPHVRQSRGDWYTDMGEDGSRFQRGLTRIAAVEELF